ncbi:LysR family transcriptional regulator [Bradyrhizobium erythrophlei]|uniref:DNA-binding transcriptional regulator, LysR family n=1 Tax=Bradyrhizobium erythrophlei TaxID=1437360 RepID=A0A1M5MNN9_9BRAD|nr:LysR family transcriptional regulator [Bradyrhizobium erythrophlei]SHG79044.1 DNA-binding transcriptional regulator, LysR family [Bradyrhizobium erythrophlei]
MNIRALQTLVAIRKNGSFIETANRLNMTSSAVSMQMKMLEQELGVSLFDRSFRPPLLTPIGKVVADKAQVALQAHNDILNTCKSTDALAGEFRIGFIPTASVRLMPEFLSKAKSEHPLARFHIETGLSEPLAQMVSSGRLDAAVITETDDLPGNLQAISLAEEELVFCLPATCARWSIDRCMSELTFIHFMPVSGIGRLIAQYLGGSNPRPAKTLILDSVEVVAECVKKGIGFAILPAPDIRRLCDDHEITQRSLVPTPVKRALVLTTITGGRMRPYLEPLTRLLTQKPGAKSAPRNASGTRTRRSSRV